MGKTGAGPDCTWPRLPGCLNTGLSGELFLTLALEQTQTSRSSAVRRLLIWIVMILTVMIFAAALVVMGNRGWYALLTPGQFCGLTLTAWLILSTPRDAIRIPASPSATLLLSAMILLATAAMILHPDADNIVTGSLTIVAAAGMAMLLRQRSASLWWLALFVFHPLVIGRMTHGYGWSTGVLVLVIGVLLAGRLAAGKPHSRLWGNIAVIAALCAPGALTSMAIFPLALCTVEWNLAGWLISLLGALCLNSALPGWLFWCLYGVCILTALWQIGGDLLNPPAKQEKPKRKPIAPDRGM